MDADEEIDVVNSTDDAPHDASGDASGDEEYEVEKILDQKGKGKNIVYLVKWKGYSSEHDSWEPKENLVGAQDLLDAFLAERAETKKKGVKRSLGESSSKTPKRVKSMSPDESVGNDVELSGEDNDEDFDVETPKNKNKSKQKGGSSKSVGRSNASKKKTPSSNNKMSSSDSRLGGGGGGANSSDQSFQRTVEARFKNNAFNSWLDSDEDDERRSVSEGRNVNNKAKEDKNIDDLDLKLKESIEKNLDEINKIDDNKASNSKELLENGKDDIVKKLSDEKAIINNDDKFVESPPPPTDPEENGQDNLKEKTNGTKSTRHSSATSNESKNNDNNKMVNNNNNTTTKQIKTQNNKKNKNEKEVSVDNENKKDGEKSLSEFRVDCMFRDSVGKLHLVANLGTDAECRISINAQLEKELASFLKTKIKPGGGSRKNKNIINDDESEG